MKVKRVSTESSLLDVLDRVLDKGIVEARVVVASIATYLQVSEPLGVPAVFASRWMGREKRLAGISVVCGTADPIVRREGHMSEYAGPADEQTMRYPDAEDIERRVQALIEAGRALKAALERFTSLAENAG